MLSFLREYLMLVSFGSTHATLVLTEVLKKSARSDHRSRKLEWSMVDQFVREMTTNNLSQSAAKKVTRPTFCGKILTRGANFQSSNHYQEFCWLSILHCIGGIFQCRLIFHRKRISGQSLYYEISFWPWSIMTKQLYPICRLNLSWNMIWNIVDSLMIWAFSLISKAIWSKVL